ncbi:hypothetical protein BJV82DRAFT_18630 [Fennellomyces sp. T-0311]|nr:hypothetical protein BJV82DRAFT_18630 [Fennellomyces sp. T-0311]
MTPLNSYSFGVAPSQEVMSFTMLRQSLGYLRIFHKRPKEKNQDSERVSNATPIIFNLPYDIMESVWLYLPMVDRLKCTQVCQLWRSQLLGSTVMWSEISGNISHCLKPYKINGSDIHQVDLERDPDGIDFLLNLKCSNLQSISGAHIRDGNVLMSFHELLCFTGLALRSLSVKAGTPFEDVLSLIFMQCSGLTHLRFIAKRSHPYRISSRRFGPVLF